LQSRLDEFSEAGFTAIWLPPPTASVSLQGYLPTDLYDLTSKFGNEEQLMSLLKKMKDRNLKSVADIVINHRCASTQKDGKWNQYGESILTLNAPLSYALITVSLAPEAPAAKACVSDLSKSKPPEMHLMVVDGCFCIARPLNRVPLIARTATVSSWASQWSQATRSRVPVARLAAKDPLLNSAFLTAGVLRTTHMDRMVVVCG
jgi:hypothetical protein